MYSKDECSICNSIKKLLTAKKLPYTERNMTHDQEAYTEISNEGFKIAPIIKHCGTYYSSPNQIHEFIRNQVKARSAK